MYFIKKACQIPGLMAYKTYKIVFLKSWKVNMAINKCPNTEIQLTKDGRK